MILDGNRPSKNNIINIIIIIKCSTNNPTKAGVAVKALTLLNIRYRFMFKIDF